MKKLIILLVMLLLFPNLCSAIELVREKGVATTITFPILDTSNVPKTGCAASGDTEKDEWSDSSDPTGFVDITDEIAEIGGTGVYYVSLSASEIDYDYLVIKTTCTGASTQFILIRTTESNPHYMASTDDGTPINVTSGAIDNVDLVDLTTTTTTATTATTCGTCTTIGATGIDAILDDPIEDALTMRQALRIYLAVLAGLSDGGGTTTIHFRDLSDNRNRITATVNTTTGDRSVVTLDTVE